MSIIGRVIAALKRKFGDEINKNIAKEDAVEANKPVAVVKAEVAVEGGYDPRKDVMLHHTQIETSKVPTTMTGTRSSETQTSKVRVRIGTTPAQRAEGRREKEERMEMGANDTRRIPSQVTPTNSQVSNVDHSR